MSNPIVLGGGLLTLTCAMLGWAAPLIAVLCVVIALTVVMPAFFLVAWMRGWGKPPPPLQ